MVSSPPNTETVAPASNRDCSSSHSGVPWRIGGIYLGIGALWLVFSGLGLPAFISDHGALESVRATGAWGFLLISGALLFALIHREFAVCLRREASLQESEKVLREQNANLEKRLRQQDGQLEIVQKELETFSYSVSHDLRAPLRGIAGFSEVLRQQYQGQLSAEGKGYLDRIKNAADRMGQLIDDLLNLSRLARWEMLKRDIDLSALAQSIVAELEAQHSDRRVTCEIPEGLTAFGDPRLLRMVLESLFANAWKFTGHQKEPRVLLSCTVGPDGCATYCVEDNGVGFDMRYASKLFGAFQRLHSPQEFPGTGMGLATVQRIVHRHGGRTWAEAKLNEGARIYFQLPTFSEP